MKEKNNLQEGKIKFTEYDKKRRLRDHLQWSLGREKNGG